MSPLPPPENKPTKRAVWTNISPELIIKILRCEKINFFKVTPDLRGRPPVSSEKKSYARNFKGKHGKLYIVEKLNKCRFRKKYELAVFLIPRKKIAKMTAKMTMRHSIKQMN